jgi:hypothetical protein
MNGGKPTPLAPTLLFAKGRAHPVGYDADNAKAAQPVRVDALSRPTADNPAAKPGGTRRGRNPPGEVRLSFHVDADRHRRLKLATAHLRRTGQEFVIAAVDHYLDHVVPGLLGRDCRCLATGSPAGLSSATGAAAGVCACGGTTDGPMG